MPTKITYSIITHHSDAENRGALRILKFQVVAKMINKKLVLGNQAPELLNQAPELLNVYVLKQNPDADIKVVQQDASTTINKELQDMRREAVHIIFLEANLITSGNRLNFDGNFFNKYQSSGVIFLLFHGSEMPLGAGADLPAFVGLQRVGGQISVDEKDFVDGKTFGEKVVKELQKAVQSKTKLPKEATSSLDIKALAEDQDQYTDSSTDIAEESPKKIFLPEFEPRNVLTDKSSGSKKGPQAVNPLTGQGSESKEGPQAVNPLTDQGSKSRSGSQFVNPLGGDRDGGDFADEKSEEQGQTGNDDLKTINEELRRQEELRQQEELRR